eukprot:m.337679 g.337679  ORF g.337679 m.337679 type:complete len:279 (-) comp18206_c0_seq1:67-903(-)
MISKQLFLSAFIVAMLMEHVSGKCCTSIDCKSGTKCEGASLGCCVGLHCVFGESNFGNCVEGQGNVFGEIGGQVQEAANSVGACIAGGLIPLGQLGVIRLACCALAPDVCKSQCQAVKNGASNLGIPSGLSDSCYNSICNYLAGGGAFTTAQTCLGGETGSTNSGGGSTSGSGDPTCSTGIKDGSVCCAASCGTCGGSGCGERSGGAASCCGSSVANLGRSCNSVGPPCTISSSSGGGGSDTGGSSSNGAAKLSSIGIIVLAGVLALFLGCAEFSLDF